jgi:hypothetical protein
MLNLDLGTLILQMDIIFTMFRSKPKKILGFYGKRVGASSTLNLSAILNISLVKCSLWNIFLFYYSNVHLLAQKIESITLGPTLFLNKGPCHLLHWKVFYDKRRNYYGNSNISPCKNISLKNSSKRRNQNPSEYYYNSIITNLKFQHKPKYHLSKILI